MAGVQNQLDDRVTRVVFEALETVASPEIAVDIIADALGMVDLEGPPSSPDALKRFIADQLWPAVVARLGIEAADVVADRLSRVADSWELSDSHVRPKRRATADYADGAPTARKRASTVLLATSDPGLADDVRERVGTHTTVEVVADAMDLLRKLEDVADRRSALVVDCPTTPIRIDTLAISAQHLPEDTPVILWRAGEHVGLERVPPSRALRWSMLRTPSGLEELATTLGHLDFD